MSKVLSVASGKGGVGKTTIASNLGAVLTEHGKNVTLVDGNLTTANLSLHLGIPLYPVTLHDVLKGDAMISEALYVHPSGVRVVPSGLGMDDIEGIESSILPESLDELTNQSDMVILDTAGGLGEETVSTLEASDETLIVTNPTLPSVTDALKTKNLAEDIGVDVLGVAVNHHSGTRHELSDAEVSEMLDGLPVISRIPRDRKVHESVSMKKPVVHHDPHTEASHAFRELASEIIGEDIEFEAQNEGFFSRIVNFLR